MTRDKEWIELERARLLGWPREELIGWLEWNDPNGAWSDEASTAQGMEPLSVEDAVDQIMPFVVETGKTPEEIASSSRRGER